ncbi:uncharacterized protein LOC124142816 isoform X2 [Haliotis rufescens]|uniref:uncharacterized protein LOC124142816 isoform X2 n=1 Tax=Haliotis rufescens TaxID=6454 RepID=UPI00201F1F52|nr:uncharacterized protein LOC124142816 isoform X2 [Haliotis rufescens]
MAVRPSTTLVMDTQQGGMQVGDNNSIYYSNCHITNITHVHNNCKQCHPTEEHDVTQDASRDLRSTSTVHTTTSVRLLDSTGRELQLGDVVFFDKTLVLSIYAGDGMNIIRDEKTGKIVLEPINVEEPFTSCSIAGQKYSGRQVVQRAKGKVGQVFHGHKVDFVWWCCWDMTFAEAGGPGIPLIPLMA